MNPKRRQVGVLVGLLFLVLSISLFHVLEVNAASLFEPIPQNPMVRSIFKRDKVQKSPVSLNNFNDHLLTASPILSGRVFKGQEPNEAQALENVIVRLYCSGNEDVLGSETANDVTDSTGLFELTVNTSCDYYNIYAETLDDFVSVGAKTDGGVVKLTTWIQYQGPLSGQILTGNKFWQVPGHNHFTGHVYNGLMGETTPLEGAKLSLYCSQVITSMGDVVDQTITGTDGWYELWGPDCNYYTIIENDPDGYVSVGASTVDGTVNNPHNISFNAPLSGLDLSGNLFWDKPATLAFRGSVFEGYKHDDSQPLAYNNILLFCSETRTSLGDIISTAITDTNGWYEVWGYEGCNFYWIFELDRDGYISTGASTVGGEAFDRGWIRYQGPITDQEMTGNRFWDVPATFTFLPLINH